MDLKSLEILFDTLGPRDAEKFTSRALDELTLRIGQMRKAMLRDDPAALAGLSRGVARVATQIGLVGLARVARDAGICAQMRDAGSCAKMPDAGNCAQMRDRVALAAIWARLDRMAARTLASTGRARDAQS